MRALPLLLALAITSPAFPCAPAPRPGERVDVVEESAVIVWEPSTKTEHFIRRATFRGAGSDFGFLVPTPSVPTLSEFDDFVFHTLVERTTRKRVFTTVKKIDWTPLFALLFANRDKGDGAMAVTARAPVEVLATQKLAGYEASILDATDAAALQTWLQDHGYATTPDLTEWLDAYIRRQWKITAFKVDRPAQTSAVKMTFTTDQPFFPYREPASQREDSSTGRLLRVFFLGPERVEGSIGGHTQWPSTTMWSEDVKTDIGIPLPPRTRLTRFDDESTPRPGTDDLLFTRSSDQREVIPAPEVIENVQTTHVPLDLVIAPLLVLGLAIRRAVRRRRG